MFLLFKNKIEKRIFNDYVYVIFQKLIFFKTYFYNSKKKFN